MQKWSYFSMGTMAGIIAVLGTIILMQNRELTAEAAAPLQSTDNTGQGLMLATGGVTPNQQDLLWVIYKHKADRKAGADTKDVVSAKDERITLCCYQIANGARNMKLAAVRDISFDMDLFEMNQDRPTVKEIVDKLREEAKKAKPEK